MKPESARDPAYLLNRASGLPHRPGAKPPEQFTITRMATAFVLGLISWLFLFGWNSWQPLILASVTTGIVVALVIGDRRGTALTGGLTGFIGALGSSVFFRYDFFGHMVLTINDRSPFALLDIIPALFKNNFATIIRANPLNRPGGSLSTLLILIIATAITMIAALVTAHGLRRRNGARYVAVVLPYSCVLALVVAYTYTALSCTPGFLFKLQSEPPAGSYAYDGGIFEKTFWLMHRGTDYYDAFVGAAAGDARLQRNHYIVDRQFHGWVVSPVMIRQPYVFLLWQLCSRHNAAGVFYLSLVVCAGAFFIVLWATLPYLGGRAVFVPVFLYPFLLSGSVWQNIFLPDWWAGLIILYAAAALLRKKMAVACGAITVAALFREILVFWLLLFCLYLTWRRVSGRTATENRKCRYIAWTLLFIFIAQFTGHYILASQYVDATATSVTQTLANRLQENFSAKLSIPTSYLMFPYGFLYFPGLIVFALSIPGFYFSLKSRPAAKHLILAYLGVWPLLFIFAGGVSSYWGLHIMPLAIIGAGYCLASTGRFIESGYLLIRHTYQCTVTPKE